MNKLFIEIDKCNCSQALSLEKQLFEQKLINQELNDGINCDLEYNKLSDHMYVMYKVGFAKYQLKMKMADKVQTQLTKYKSQEEKLLNIMAEVFWLTTKVKLKLFDSTLAGDSVDVMIDKCVKLLTPPKEGK